MMWRPHFLWVGGPAGAGKTSFLERLVASWRSREVGCLRVVEDPTCDGVCRDEDVGEEGERWLAAGAHGVARVRLGEARRGSVLVALEAMPAWLEQFDVVAVEGGLPLRRAVDVAVFVTRPLSGGAAFTVQERREVGRLDGQEALSLLLGRAVGEEAQEDDEPGPLASARGSGDEAEDGDETPEGDDGGIRVHDSEWFDAEEEEVIDSFEIPDEVGYALIDLLENGQPLMAEGTWLLDEAHGLEAADVAVVNVTRDEAPGSAQRTASEIEGLRGREILGPRGVRYLWDEFPRTVMVADLADRRHEGTAKAVASIKRRTRRQ